MNENEKLEELNITDNSILSVYENVKKMNNFKSLIAENNEGILKEISKFDAMISSIEGELNTFKKQSITAKELQKLENKLNADFIQITEKDKKETNESLQEIIEKLENNKESNEEQIELLNKKIKELEATNKALIDIKIAELNIDDIKNNITEAKETITSKIKETSVEFNNKLNDVDKNNSEILKKINGYKKTSDEKASELNQILKRELAREKKEREKSINKVNDELTHKIEKLNNTDAIEGLKEKIINVEKYNKTVSKKLANAITINQRNLSEIKKAYEISSQELQQYIEEELSKMNYTPTIQIITKELNLLKKKIKLLEESQNSEATVRKNIEYIIEQRLKEQENKYIKNIDAIVDKKVKETIKEMAKQKKTKQATIKQQEQIINYSSNIKNNTMIKAKNPTPKTNFIRPDDEIIDTVYNTRNTRRRQKSSSLDDMVATLSQMPNSQTRNSAKKTISTLNKAVKKSQILKYDS